MLNQILTKGFLVGTSDSSAKIFTGKLSEWRSRLNFIFRICDGANSAEGPDIDEAARVRQLVSAPACLRDRRVAR